MARTGQQAAYEESRSRLMVEQFPAWADRITYWHVDDLDCATADEALPLCESCVKSLVERLLTEQEKQ